MRPTPVVSALGTLLLTATVAHAAPATPTSTASAPRPVSVELTQATVPAIVPAATAANAWVAPSRYSVDMVMTSKDGTTMTMKRTIDGARIRTEISSDGMTMSMIETGDADGTRYMIMPEGKTVMKISGKTVAQAKKSAGVDPAAESAGGAGVQPELLGQETIDGRVCDKYRCVTPEGEGTAWIDAETHQPVKMLSDGNTVEFKNMRIGAPPKDAFELPKDYEVVDMEAQMSKVQGMGGGGGMGMGGMGLGSMASGMAGNLGGNLGGGLGSSLGGMLGGPIGAMAGGYLGGKIGSMLGHKAAGAVTGSN
jgi:hypothetical protein